MSDTVITIQYLIKLFGTNKSVKHSEATKISSHVNVKSEEATTF